MVQLAEIEPARFIQLQDFKLFYHFNVYCYLIIFNSIVFTPKSFAFLFLNHFVLQYKEFEKYINLI